MNGSTVWVLDPAANFTTLLPPSTTYTAPALSTGTDGYALVQAFGPAGYGPMSYQKACEKSFDIDGGARIPAL